MNGNFVESLMKTGFRRLDARSLYHFEACDVCKLAIFNPTFNLSTTDRNLQINDVALLEYVAEEVSARDRPIWSSLVVIALLQHLALHSIKNRILVSLGSLDGLVHNPRKEVRHKGAPHLQKVLEWLAAFQLTLLASGVMSHEIAQPVDVVLVGIVRRVLVHEADEARDGDVASGDCERGGERGEGCMNLGKAGFFQGADEIALREDVDVGVA